ncbi:MAG: YigZ family protein [Cytophagales bacterium]|nr:YigZ family protein [Cytophagales bacterium]
MADDSFLTITGTAEGLYKEKGSKFISYAYPVETEEEIREYVEQLHKQYYDARHHCYAWVLGKDQERFRANDDGEPGHSAGDPILNKIKSFNLTNVLVVVVRYFGGTKLGVPGLVNAYKTATEEALLQADIVERIVKDRITLYFDYLSMNLVMKFIKDYELEMVDQVFDNQCKVVLAVRLTDSPMVIGKLESYEFEAVKFEVEENEGD